VATEEEGRQLARRLGVSGAALTREFVAADRAFQISPEDLLVRLAEVQVRGIDLESLPMVRSLDVPASALLGRASRYGHTALATDPDGRVRGVQHLVRWVSPQGRTHVLPSLALAGALARASSRQLLWSDGRLAVVGGRSIPADRSGYAILRWDAAEAGRTGRGSLQRAIPSWRFLQNLFDADNGVPAHARNEVQRRAAVLADTSSGQGEWPQTPLGPGVSHAAVVGQALENLLDGAGIERAPVRRDVLATFALAFLGAFLALGFSGVFRSFIGGLIYLGTAALAVAGWLVWVRHLFLAEGRWVAAGGPLVAFGLAWLLTIRYALRTERQMRDFVYGALGRYVSPDVADQVFRNVELMRPQRREVTLCYADLESFRTLTRSLKPELLVELLNTYFSELTHLVRQTGGHVEYVGDALLAFWGAPVRLDRHAAVACRTALSIQEELERLRPEWQRRFGVEVRARMALHSGDVVAGDMGSAFKANYTVLGEPVGVAERLEGASRLYATALLASAETVRRAGDGFVFRELDVVNLGAGPQTLYELLGRKGEIPAALQTVLEGWPSALARVRMRDFAGALAFFEAHAATDPVSGRWAERVRGYLASPPPPDWDGRGDLRRGG
jgi:adenylate cyclase